MRDARYDPMVVQPMRDELTQIGVKEPLTPDDVEVLGAEDRTVLMVVNSVCGCAAGKARPGVRLALKHSVRPAGSPPCSPAWRSMPRSVPVATS
jgi:putative YphP/YqiW family bacilliredoxin